MTVVTGMLTATAVLYDSNSKADGVAATKPPVTTARYYDYTQMGYVSQQ
ncbi:hypothetical protein NOF55_11085 [Rhizobiaceae bacterium BDR2-2]|uniref:Uncharacterized protein n=1 Tax=Ectorhizobium quercum TaxID=2965071 RepID=A0AAE3N0E9_9HYPH|nr:hypothetical protein [Ectorhizobium quercum]MCX8997647.1 hypothetical protein [Ectorhizobium quercum]